MILAIDGHLRYLQRIDMDVVAPFVKAIVLKSSEADIDMLKYGLVDALERGNAQGIKTSLFHWYSPSTSITEQAAAIMRVVSKSPSVRIIWIDNEQHGSNYKNDPPLYSPQQISDGVRALIDQLTLLTDVPIGTYENPFFIWEHAQPMLDWIFEYPVWWASYITYTIQDMKWENLPVPSAVLIQWPPGWPEDKKGCDVWQWTGDRMKLPGIYKKDLLGQWVTTPVELDLLVSDRIKRIYGLEEKMELHYPVDEGKFNISQHFGEDPAHYTQSRGHNGTDWATPVGSNAYSLRGGKVLVAELRVEKTGYGGQVRVQHENGISIIGHLSKILVKVGDAVETGQLVGLTGGASDSPYSGNSTGPHIHAEYRLTIGAPQVPGGFAYGAIDIEPLLVSLSQEEPLYHVKTIISNLTVRRSPVIGGIAIRNAGLGIFPVYEERDGYGRISRIESEWIYLLNPNYAVKVSSEIPVPGPVEMKWAEMSVEQKLEKLREKVGGIE